MDKHKMDKETVIFAWAGVMAQFINAFLGNKPSSAKEKAEAAGDFLIAITQMIALIATSSNNAYEALDKIQKDIDKNIKLIRGALHDLEAKKQKTTGSWEDCIDSLNSRMN